MNNNQLWILAEQKDGIVQKVSYELLNRGRQLAQQNSMQLSAMIFGNNLDSSGLQNLIACGADRVVAIQSPSLEKFRVKPYSACMMKIIAEYNPLIIIAAATSTGRTLMPYVAIKAKTGLTADCTELAIDPETGDLLQTRPAIGGNIMATIKTPSHRPQMATVRPHSTAPAKPLAGRTGEIINLTIAPELIETPVSHKDFIPNEDAKSLAESDVIVAVGRGIKKAENLPMIYELADLLGAAVGATRDVVDRGWLSYPHQVGLSGQTVTPKLYVAIGLSGTIQHLAGMQTAENIIAVNSDSDAQIFKVANLGIVGDLFKVVPQMISKIKEGKAL